MNINYTLKKEFRKTIYRILSAALLVAVCASMALVPANAAVQAQGPEIDGVMSCIRSLHPEIATCIPGNITFTRVIISTPPGTNYQCVVYHGYNWIVTINHTSSAGFDCAVRAEYDRGRIIWIGQINNRMISEVDYRYMK